MRSQKTGGLMLPPEMTLLLRCSVNEPTEAERAEIHNLIQNCPDWKQFLQLVLKHRVYPAVYKNLKRTGATIDAAVLSALAKKTERNRMWSLSACAELFRLMEALEAAGVRAVCLKGPVLSFLTCGDISMRVSKDLDLLVSPSELEKAGQILLDQGYVLTDRIGTLTARQRTVLLKSGYHVSYGNPKTGLEVELHWRLFSESFHFNFETIWATKSTQRLNGKTVPVLGPEENLLYLVFHGSKHMWFRLKWLCDIAEILQKGGLDWDRLAERAGELGIGRLLAQALILSSAFYKTQLRDGLFEKRALRSARRLSRLSIPIILSDDEQAVSSGHSLFLLGKRYMLAWNAGLARKFRYAKALMSPIVKDFDRCRVSDRHFALYYFMRPLFVLERVLRPAGKRGKV